MANAPNEAPDEGEGAPSPNNDLTVQNADEDDEPPNEPQHRYNLRGTEISYEH
jgi:hypothetical protein